MAESSNHQRSRQQVTSHLLVTLDHTHYTDIVTSRYIHGLGLVALAWFMSRLVVSTMFNMIDHKEFHEIHYMS